MDGTNRVEEEVLAQRSGAADGRAARRGLLALPGSGISDVWEAKEEGREQDAPATMDGLLRVGMSVPAHPQAIERLGGGDRGWLKPPPPED